MPVRDSINDTIVLIYHGYCSRGNLLGEGLSGRSFVERDWRRWWCFRVR